MREITFDLPAPRGIYLLLNKLPLVLPYPTTPLAVPAGACSRRWLTGLLLDGFQWPNLHPEVAERGHVPFIQASFQATILTPFTA